MPPFDLVLYNQASSIYVSEIPFFWLHHVNCPYSEGMLWGNKRHSNALPLSLLQATKQSMFFKGLMKIQLKEYVLRYPGQWIPVSFSFLWMGVCLIVESRHTLELYYMG